ncbi:MAG: RNA methyltransferase, partial [Deltaproteobacteria bacterium]|nr:RNA methyltransferase [Deltaproteobacteria bacterium]
MDSIIRDRLIEHLGSFVSDNKLTKIEDVLRYRTRYVTLVLEDIFKAHNANATIRTSECMGVQDIHIIENSSPFSISDDVTQGSSKWVSLHRYRTGDQNNTVSCFQALRDQGYYIIATTLDEHSLELDAVPLDKKMAFVFGNEDQGMSDYTLQNADATLKLPMHGFTQSYNISVCVAMTLSAVIGRLHRSDIAWQLSEEEQQELKLEWYKKIVRRSDLIEKVF